MRRNHFETLRPLCVVCDAHAPLAITSTIREQDDDLLEGILGCTNADCLREYPVIDGIPILIGPIRAWFAANPLQVLLRDDLSPQLESLLGDALGSGSSFDTIRQHTGIYAGDQYSGTPSPLLARVPLSDGPTIDLGCASGGLTFALSPTSLTLGVDLNFAMLRVASRVLREGHLRYPRRRTGLVYDRIDMPINPPTRDRVDFWCCDATALPFSDATFSLATAFNLIDCVPSPRQAITEIARILQPGAHTVLTTPYDWSIAATPIENWIGGHSQRGPHGGASEPLLRAMLLSEGIEIVEEDEHVTWRVRLHERSSVDYDVHVIVGRR